MTPRTRAGIVLTAEDTSGPGFASFRRNLAGAQAQVTTVASQVGGLAGKFGTIGVALAAAFSGASIKGAVDLGDQLDDLSEKTGIAVSELSALRYAGEVTGTPLTSLADGVRKLSTTMAEAAGGAKEQGRLFDALDISVKNLDGTLKSSDQVLGELADKFASFEDGPAKAALAVKIFGKAGADMIPLLNQGSRGIAELREEGRQLGAVIGEDFARQSAAFNDNLRKIELNVEGVKRGIAQELLPTLNTLAEAFLESRDGSSNLAEVFGGSVRTALQAGAVLFANVSFVLKGVGREIGALAAQAVALATLDIDGFNAISEAVKEDGVRARKELDELERRILQTGSSLAGAGRGTAPDPRALGPVGSIQEQTRGWRRQAPVVDSSVSKEISAYEKLSKAIAERMALMDQELALGRALTDQEKFEIKVLEDLAGAKGKISAADAARIKAALEEAKARSLQLDVSRAQLKAAQDEAAERQRLRNQDDQNVKEFLQDQERAAAQQLASLRDRIEGVKAETEAADLAARANIGLAEAVEQVAIARLQERLAWLNDDGEEAERVRAEIAERQRLIEVLRTQRIGERTRESIKESREESKRLFESIYEGLSDSLFRGFEAGKGFFRSFWDGVKNTIKTTVLRVAVQGVMGMTPFAAMAGQGGATGTVGGAINAASGVGSIASLATGAGMFGSGVASGLTAWGAGGSVTGVVGSALNGSLFAGGIANGLGVLAGALGPIALGIAAIMSFVKDRGGPKADGRAGLTFSGIGDFDNSLKAGAEPVLAGLQTQYDQLARAFGAQAAVQFGVAFSKDPKGTSPTFLEFAGSRDGKALFSDTNLNVGRSDEELKAALEEATTGALLKALRASNLDQPFADFFAGVAADASKQAKEAAVKTATEVASYSGSIRDLGGVFERLTQLSVATRGALIDAAGGLQALTQSTAAYYENFYSQEERRRITAAQISRTLGDAGISVGIEQVLGATRAQFRSLVDSLDVTTEGGQKAFTALMGVAGAFASITPELEAVGSVAQEAAVPVETLAQALDRLRNPLRSVEDIARSIFDLGREGQGLQVELLRAQGDDPAARALQRALDTVGFTEAEIALYDYNQGLRDQIEQTIKARDAEAALTQARADQQLAAERARADQIERINDKFAAAAKDFMSADEFRSFTADGIVNRLGRAGLEVTREGVLGASKDDVRRLYGEAANAGNMNLAEAILDASAAFLSLQPVLEDTAAVAARIAQERFGLETQLLQLQGDTTALRARERDALDESNRALFDQIKALQDQKTATEAAAAAARNAANERYGLETRLLQLQGNTSELRARERLALDESNRSLFDQIVALEDLATAADKAAEATRNAYRSMSDMLTGIVAGLENKWNELFGSITEEVDRIRGLWTQDKNLSMDGARGAFMTAASAAMGGDADSARLLPGLSQALLNVAEAQSTSLVDLRRTQALTAQILESTLGPLRGARRDEFERLAQMFAPMRGIASYDVGTPYVPSTGLALLHEGEAVIPAAYNPWAGGASRDSERLERLVEGLTQEVQRLRAQVAEGTTHQRRTADAVNGNPEQPMLVEVAA